MKGVKTGGRKAGVANKVTVEFRETVTRLLQENSANVGLWLTAVANGADGDEENGIPRRAADPGKALDLMSKLAEYAYPKLARTEVTGKDGGPQEHTYQWLE